MSWGSKLTLWWLIFIYFLFVLQIVLCSTNPKLKVDIVYDQDV